MGQKPPVQPGRPQGIAPTVVTITLGRPIRTIVGAIPCGRPPLARGAYFTRMVAGGRPGWTGGLFHWYCRLWSRHLT